MKIEIRYLRVVALLMGVGIKAGERVKAYSKESFPTVAGGVRHRFGMCLQDLQEFYRNQLFEPIRLEEIAANAGLPRQSQYATVAMASALNVRDVSKIFGALITRLECVANTFCTMRCQGTNQYVGEVSSETATSVDQALEVYFAVLMDYIAKAVHERGTILPWGNIMDQRLQVANILRTEYQERSLKYIDQGSIQQHFGKAAQELGNEVQGLEFLVTRASKFEDYERSLDREQS